MRIENWSVWCDVNICVRCGSWLSLGPSADKDPRVAIEITAARDAAKYQDAGRTFGVDRFDYCPATRSDELCALCETLYLARAIVEHGDGGG